MFGKKSNRTAPGSIDCLISAKTRIEGDVYFEGGLRIDGRIQGNLLGSDSSLLIVSDQANVEGEARAAHAVINGAVKGSVHASQRLELQSKACVTGDVYYRTLEMCPGAVVEGRLVHQPEGVAIQRLESDSPALEDTVE